MLIIIPPLPVYTEHIPRITSDAGDHPLEGQLVDCFIAPGGYIVVGGSNHEYIALNALVAEDNEGHINQTELLKKEQEIDSLNGPSSFVVPRTKAYSEGHLHITRGKVVANTLHPLDQLTPLQLEVLRKNGLLEDYKHQLLNRSRINREAERGRIQDLLNGMLYNVDSRLNGRTAMHYNPDSRDPIFDELLPGATIQVVARMHDTRGVDPGQFVSENLGFSPFHFTIMQRDVIDVLVTRDWIESYARFKPENYFLSPLFNTVYFLTLISGAQHEAWQTGRISATTALDRFLALPDLGITIHENRHPHNVDGIETTVSVIPRIIKRESGGGLNLNAIRLNRFNYCVPQKDGRLLVLACKKK